MATIKENPPNSEEENQYSPFDLPSFDKLGSKSFRSINNPFADIVTKMGIQKDEYPLDTEALQMFLAGRRSGQITSAERPQWDRLFDISGNSSPDEATIIIMSEGSSHVDPLANGLLSEYLRAHAKKEDSILLEGYPSGSKIDRTEIPTLAGLGSDIQLFGWDDMEAFAKGSTLFDELDALQKELKCDIPDVEKVTLTQYRDFDLRPRIHDIAIVQRNESLMKTITNLEQSWSEHQARRIFVVAGLRHQEDDVFHLFLKPRSYATLVTRSFFG